MQKLNIPHDHGGDLPQILAEMPKEPAFEKASEVFSQLSDPTRLRIVWLLCHSEECVTNIAAAIGMSDPAVSHHLRILKKASLAVSRRIGKEVHYTLASTKEADLVRQMIGDIFEVHNKPD